MRKLLLAALLTTSCYGGGTLYTLFEDASVYGFGQKITAATGVCDSDHYTGWISTHNVDEVVFHTTHTNDADGAVTMNMTCEVTNDRTEANGAGFEVCSQTTTAGVSTYTCPNTWRLTGVNADREWKWSVTDIQAKYLNCLFDCGSDNDDTIAVWAYGVSP